MHELPRRLLLPRRRGRDRRRLLSRALLPAGHPEPGRLPLPGGILRGAHEPDGRLRVRRLPGGPLLCRRLRLAPGVPVGHLRAHGRPAELDPLPLLHGRPPLRERHGHAASVRRRRVLRRRCPRLRRVRGRALLRELRGRGGGHAQRRRRLVVVLGHRRALLQRDLLRGRHGPRAGLGDRRMPRRVLLPRGDRRPDSLPRRRVQPRDGAGRGGGLPRRAGGRLHRRRRVRERHRPVQRRLLLPAGLFRPRAGAVPSVDLRQQHGRGRRVGLRALHGGRVLPGGLGDPDPVPGGLLLPRRRRRGGAVPARQVRQCHGALRERAVHSLRPRLLLRHAGRLHAGWAVRPGLLLLRRQLHVRAGGAGRPARAEHWRRRRPLPARRLLPGGQLGGHRVPAGHVQQLLRRPKRRRLHHVRPRLLLRRLEQPRAHGAVQRRLLLPKRLGVADREPGVAGALRAGGLAGRDRVRRRHLHQRLRAERVHALHRRLPVPRNEHDRAHRVRGGHLLRGGFRLADALREGHLQQPEGPDERLRVPRLPRWLLLRHERPDRAHWQVLRGLLLQRPRGDAAESGLRGDHLGRPLHPRALLPGGHGAPGAVSRGVLHEQPGQHGRVVLRRPQRERQRGLRGADLLHALPGGHSVHPDRHVRPHGERRLYRRAGDVRCGPLVQARREDGIAGVLRQPDGLRGAVRHLPRRVRVPRRELGPGPLRRRNVHERHRLVGVLHLPGGLLLRWHRPQDAPGVPGRALLPSGHGLRRPGVPRRQVLRQHEPGGRVGMPGLRRGLLLPLHRHDRRVQPRLRGRVLLRGRFVHPARHARRRPRRRGAVPQGLLLPQRQPFPRRVPHRQVQPDRAARGRSVLHSVRRRLVLRIGRVGERDGPLRRRVLLQAGQLRASAHGRPERRQRPRARRGHLPGGKLVPGGVFQPSALHRGEVQLDGGRERVRHVPEWLLLPLEHERLRLEALRSGPLLPQRDALRDRVPVPGWQVLAGGVERRGGRLH